MTYILFLLPVVAALVALATFPLMFRWLCGDDLRRRDAAQAECDRWMSVRRASRALRWDGMM